MSEKLRMIPIEMSFSLPKEHDSVPVVLGRFL